MFFALTHTIKDNFPCQHTLPNGLVLNTDQGWETHHINDYHIVFKGYANRYTSQDLVQLLIDQHTPSIKGNFCAVITHNNTTKIIHDTDRSFPMWTDSNTITNLQPLEQQIWADCVLTVNNDFKITRDWYQPYHKPQTQLTDQQIVEQLHQTLLETYEQFLSHNTKPIKMFLSGGIDTTTSWAYLDHFTKNYEMVDYEYMKFTDFYKKNTSLVRQHWGYLQIHLWDEDCVLVTGGNGDENFLRGPNTLGMALKQHDVKFKHILEPNDYHYWYLTQKDIDAEIDQWYADTDDVHDWILNRNINDHQHWHLDRTITFTPFKDIGLLETILCASKDLLVAQAKNGDINRQLIAKLDASKLDKISTQKNYNHMESV